MARTESTRILFFRVKKPTLSRQSATAGPLCLQFGRNLEAASGTGPGEVNFNRLGLFVEILCYQKGNSLLDEDFVIFLGFIQNQP